MNAHTFPRAESGIERELSEIDALERALQKRKHFLKRAAFWQGVQVTLPSEPTKLNYARNMDHADSYQPEILLAAYRLLEIDAIHDAYVATSAEGEAR